MTTKVPRLVFLTGGIGNQLFQFSYGRWLASNFGLVVRFASLRSSHVHDSSSLVLEEIESVAFPERLEEVLFKLAHRASLAIHKDLLSSPSSNLVSRSMPIQVGYWQTPFFLDNWNSPRETKQQQIRKALGVGLGGSNADETLVHIRRGDYRSRVDEFGLLSSGYYRSSLEKLGVEPADPIAVLSDEPQFALEMIRNLGWKNAFIPPENELHPAEVLDYASRARRIVLSNSTFAWWAGTLGCSKKLVVAPSRWFKSKSVSSDLLRTEWKKVESEWSDS